MKKVLVVIFLLGSIISFSSCSNDNPASLQNDQPTITYKNLPCDNGGLEKPSAGEGISFTWALNNNKLDIDFRYDATCGCVFRDSITYLDNVLSVNLQDTSSVHYHCTCNFGTQAALNIGNEKQIRLKFSLAQFNSSDYHLLLDTLLVVRP